MNTSAARWAKPVIFFDFFESACLLFDGVEQKIDEDMAKQLFCRLAGWLDNDDYEPRWIRLGQQEVYMHYEEWVVLYEHLDRYMSRFFSVQ